MLGNGSDEIKRIGKKILKVGLQDQMGVFTENMDEILKAVRDNWEKPEELKKVLIAIVEEYRIQARSLAAAVLSEASTFNAEMEDSFKPSVTKAEYRAKELVGNTKIIAEREMRALELLFEAVKLVISSSSKKQIP